MDNRIRGPKLSNLNKLAVMANGLYPNIELILRPMNTLAAMKSALPHDSSQPSASCGEFQHPHRWKPLPT